LSSHSEACTPSHSPKPAADTLTPSPTRQTTKLKGEVTNKRMNTHMKKHNSRQQQQQGGVGSDFDPTLLCGDRQPWYVQNEHGAGPLWVTSTPSSSIVVERQQSQLSTAPEASYLIQLQRAHCRNSQDRLATAGTTLSATGMSRGSPTGSPESEVQRCPAVLTR